MKREKKLIGDLKCYAKHAIEIIEIPTGKINDFDEGYKMALKHVLELIERYEKETNNNK